MSEAAWLLIDRAATVLGLVTGLASLAAAVWSWSLGLFMAAEETGATTLYVSADFDPALQSLRPGSQRLVAVTTPAA
jgi:hypothetical protein